MVECIRDPEPECCFGEKCIPLAKHVQLWIAIENASRDELVENTDDEWRENSEDDVVH